MHCSPRNRSRTFQHSRVNDIRNESSRFYRFQNGDDARDDTRSFLEGSKGLRGGGWTGSAQGCTTRHEGERTAERRIMASRNRSSLTLELPWGRERRTVTRGYLASFSSPAIGGEGESDLQGKSAWRSVRGGSLGEWMPEDSRRSSICVAAGDRRRFRVAVIRGEAEPPGIRVAVEDRPISIASTGRQPANGPGGGKRGVPFRV
ncbi:hypothetical protein WN48_04202 [Eufriesea mexicana]|uniref:Uncharacterized protein n=1 Tax=Eufriesea mexicana TaxID=516756 RepID=A0A310SLJ8_9HYME|nr:hypothetical protein WN48_04202 [Eufriesea mexicana]